RLELRPALRERVLDRLVHADGPVEHYALLRVLGRALHRYAAQAHEARADQDSLRVDAVQEVAKALAFLADAVLDRDFHAVEEQLVGVDALAAHLLDLADLHLAAIEVGVEQAQSVDRARLVAGARDEQD